LDGPAWSWNETTGGSCVCEPPAVCYSCA
jgi:hypothetical protein